MTVGSEGIIKFWQPVAYGAARMREALRGRASNIAGVEAETVNDDNNGFKLSDGHKIFYRDLVSDEPFFLKDTDMEENQNVELYSLQNSRKHHHVGHNRISSTMKSIVTGAEIYARDFKIPDMLFGHFFRPPAFGANIKKINLNNIENIEGVIRVEKQIEKNVVAIVAKDPISLRLAVKEINVIWQLSRINTTELLERIDVNKIIKNNDLEHILVNKVDNKEFARNSKVIKSSYSTPYMAHASMETRAATAWVRQGKVEIWCGSQDPFFVQNRVAKLFGNDLQDVVVHSLRVGGDLVDEFYVSPPRRLLYFPSLLVSQ